MRKCLTYLLPLVLVVFSISSYAQDIHFSQFSESPQLINPGLTGVFPGDVRIAANYRDQWTNVDVPYRTFGFNYDHRLFHNKWDKASLAFGIAAYRDDAGDLGLHTTSGVISLSSTLNVSRQQSITAGIQSGIIYRGVNMSDAIWGSQYDGSNYDPTTSSGETSDFNTFFDPDVSMGFSWNLDALRGMGPFHELRIVAGTGLFHINQPRQKFNLSEDDKLHLRWTVHGRAEMGIGTGRSYIVPLFLFELQGPSTEAVFGALYRFMLKEASKTTGFIKGSALSIGATYRWGDAITPTLLLELDKFAVAISYDVNMSGLSKATAFQGGLEISLRFTTPNPFYFSGRKAKSKYDLNTVPH